VCDSCNNYLGRLDQAVASHPFIAFAIQSLALPGKTNRPRSRVGNVSVDAQPAFITIPCSAPEWVRTSDGGRECRMIPLIDRSFDMLRFRRGIHHIAFNFMAWHAGVDRMYESDFDQARSYIRRPTPKQSWGIGQYVIDILRPTAHLFGGVYSSAKDEYVGLRVFSTAFFVDLFNTGGLEDFLGRYQPKGTQYLAPSYVPPRPSKARAGKRYRVSIEADTDRKPVRHR
jgi:hypothetical protein